MKVRDAVPGDFDHVATVLIDAYTAEWGESGWDDYRLELADVRSRAAAMRILVATTELDEVIGTVALLVPSSIARKIEARDAMELRMLAVSPIHQRNGVATALIHAATAATRAAALGRILLQSDDDLVAAHRLYATAGFTRRPEFDIAVDDGHTALAFELAVPHEHRSRG